MRRPRRLSIVPSLGSPPPPPLRIALELILSSWLVGFALGSITMLIGPLVLALPGVTVTGVLRLALAQTVVAWFVLLIGTVLSVWRMRPIYDTLMEGDRVSHRGPPPPAAAVRAAFHAPERVVWSVTLSAQATVLVDALGWVSVSGLAGWPRVALSLMAAAITCAGLHPSIMLWRSILWQWLGRLHPDDVPDFKPAKLGVRLAFTAALPVAMVGVCAVVVMLSHLFAFQASQVVPHALLPSPWWTDSLTPRLALAMILASTVGTWWLVRRVGARTAGDLTRMSDEVARVQRRGRPSTRAQLAVFELLPRTQAGADLGEALADWAGRISEIAEGEQAAGRAMEGVRRLRAQFIASVSHDLRSPLNAIVGFSDLVASGSEGPITAGQHESVQMIHRSARDLLRLVNNILDWAKLDAGHLQVIPLPVSGEEFVGEIRRMALDVIGDRPVVLNFEVAPGLPELGLDVRRVAQAVGALIEHCASMVEHGRIGLDLRWGRNAANDRREVHLYVSDDGPGIREADRDHVFEAFRDIQDPSGRRVRGLGVGLAVAREVVRAHGGDIVLHKTGARGSSFLVSLPLGRGGSGMPVPVRTIPPPGG